MASHEELIAELPKLEKMSNAARLKLAKKRRVKQLKRYTETERASRLASVGGESRLSRKAAAGPSRINFEDSSLLHDAVQANNLEEVEKLLERGVTCSHSNADGLTPLHRCCIENTVDMAQLLIDNGADLCARDIEGWTPLHAASACGNLAMINLLMSSGANLVSTNHDDKMPVDVACDSDIRYVIQQKMLEEGFTDDVCKFMRDSVPMTMLADLKEHVKNGQSINIKDKYGASPLHIAASNGYLEVMEFILSQPDVDIDIQDNEGWTPFHAAVCWEQKESMRLLAERHACLDKQDIHGDTPFAVSEVPEIRQYILDLKQQYTAPHSVAVSFSHDEMLASTDSRGRTRSHSVRRHSMVDRAHDLKKISSREEKLMLQKSLEAEDIERTASGEAMDDNLLDDMEQSLVSSHSQPPHSPGIQETSLGGNNARGVSPRLSDSSAATTPPRSPLEDGMLGRDDVEKALDGPRKNIVSILRNKNPTPVKRESLEAENVPSQGGSLRRNRPPTVQRECCILL